MSSLAQKFSRNVSLLSSSHQNHDINQLLTEEKDVLKSLKTLSKEKTQAARALATWGKKEYDDILDVSEKVDICFENYNEAILSYIGTREEAGWGDSLVHCGTSEHLTLSLPLFPNFIFIIRKVWDLSAATQGYSQQTGRITGSLQQTRENWKVAEGCSQEEQTDRCVNGGTGKPGDYSGTYRGRFVLYKKEIITYGSHDAVWRDEGVGVKGKKIRTFNVERREV